MKKLVLVGVMSVAFLSSWSASADVFDDHMIILCKAIYPPFDTERLEGILKTPYILKNFVFPPGDPRYPNCSARSPLAMTLKHGPPENVQRLLAAGFSNLTSTDTLRATGTPVTPAQVTLFYSVFGSQGPAGSGTEMIDKFRIFWRHWESTRGVASVEAEMKMKNAGGLDALQFVCTGMPNPGHGTTFWEHLKNFETRGWVGGREIVGYVARHAGYTDAQTRALCPGWTP